MRNLAFENIYINNENKTANPVFQVVTNENEILGLTVENLNISGEQVQSVGKDLICTGNIKDLQIK
jgi:hypothetical protein